jgi:ERF superfamily
MEESDKPTIFELIPKVMEDIGAVSKSGTGDVPYKFRGIDQVMNAVHPALVKHGVFIVPEVLEWKDERLANGRAHLVMLRVAYDIYGPRGDKVRAVGVGESVDYSDKATNQAMSMAYKYAILETFCITTEDMQDGDSRKPDIPEETSQPSQRSQRNRQEPKSRSGAGGASAQHNRETGEKVHNLTKLMTDTESGVPLDKRGEFLTWLRNTHGCGINAVPDSARDQVEKQIKGYVSDASESSTETTTVPA